jgi:hypothetical protein
MKAGYLFVGACLLAAVLPVFVIRADRAPGQSDPNKALQSGSRAARAVAVQALAATHFRDRPLTQQPLTALEARFAANFPGTIARYRAAEATLIVREVTQPTRQLHSAVDCFRAAGYAVGAPRTHEDGRQTRWNCFEASLDGRRWRVCERIADSAGNQWTDVSSWYWDALWSRRTPGAGSWWATTLVTPIESEEKT